MRLYETTVEKVRRRGEEEKGMGRKIAKEKWKKKWVKEWDWRTYEEDA